MKTVWLGLESLHEDSHLASYDGPERHDRLLLKTLLDELAMLREPIAVRHDDEMPLPSIPDEELSASSFDGYIFGRNKWSSHFFQEREARPVRVESTLLVQQIIGNLV